MFPILSVLYVEGGLGNRGWEGLVALLPGGSFLYGSSWETRCSVLARPFKIKIPPQCLSASWDTFSVHHMDVEYGPL